jgi:DMSO/TMAO reductase YedYZ heme-binding membrane subunit
VNEHVWWYLSRASGIVALVLLVLSLIWGVLLATRVLKPADRPAWLLDLHTWLSGTAIFMTFVHLLGLVLDGYVSFGPAELFVPGASTFRPAAVAVGIVSFYVMLAVQVTSSLRRWLSKRAWRAVHMLSYVLVWGAAIHAGMAGTDVTHRLYQALAFVLSVAAVTASLVRIMPPRRRPLTP